MVTELVWGSVGQRYFETGVDRGVLYPKTGSGVAWHGLTAVNESPTGGEAKAFYADGYKYLNISSVEEFAATIEAYSAPPEFAACDGTRSVLNGLFITEQPRESFGLSYRTRVGNDEDGTDHGYKIHLVYNCLAAPAQRNNQSISGSLDAINLSWGITTLAPPITGYRPSAHFVIDTRYSPQPLVAQLEGMLYGSSESEPYLPDIADIMEMFNSLVTVQMLKEQPDGSFAFELVPAIRHSIAPQPTAGQSILWLDTSAGDYAKLTLVTGE